MGLDDDIAILAAAPVFGLFDAGALRLLSFAGDRRSLAAGETLFARGERADGGYVVLSGTIALAPRGRNGSAGEPVRAGPACLIGRNTLFVAGERATDATAETPAEVMRIGLQLMTRVLREFPDAAVAIRASMAQDLRELTQGLGAVRARLVHPPRR